jgi:uncharacterized repeat protein (TIGR02543 family)
MSALNNITIKQMAYNATKVKKWYHNDVKVFSAGNVVTYYVNSDKVYQEEVDSEASCLSPTTFTPTLDGWSFIGWREDSVANSTVLKQKIMGDNPINLYAVFQKQVSVTFYDGSSTATASRDFRYYNNGNVKDPTFVLTQCGKSGWTTRGWSTSTAGDGAISYNNSTPFTRSSDITLYGMYQQGVTITYYNGSTTASTTSGIRYYNPGSGKIVNPTFTLTQAAKTGWSVRGWSTSTSGSGAISYSNATAFTRESNVTLYGMYQQTITLTYYNNSTTASTTSGTRYYNSGSDTYTNPSFTLTQAAKSGWTARGWSKATAGDGAISYSNATAFTISASTTLRGMYQQTITCSFKSNGTQTVSGTRYYNSNGTTVNASVKVPNGVAISGWTWRGWSGANVTTGNAAVSYANGSTITNLSAGYTFYGLYQLGINLYTVSNGSTKTNTGYRYYNAYGTYVNPSFTIAAPTRSGWTFKGWSSSPTSTSVAHLAITQMTLTANMYLYAVWNCPNATGSVNVNYQNRRSFRGSEVLHTILSAVDTSKYSAITLTFSYVNVTCDYRGKQIDVYISDGTSKTRIGYSYCDWGSPANQYKDQGIVTKPTLTFSSSSGNKPVYITSDCHDFGTAPNQLSTGYVSVYGMPTSYTLTGRTVVY